MAVNVLMRFSVSGFILVSTSEAGLVPTEAQRDNVISF